MLTKIETMNIQNHDVRTRLNQSESGMKQLQVYMIHPAQAYCPNRRSQNTARSNSDPEYQAVQISTRYE